MADSRMSNDGQVCLGTRHLTFVFCVFFLPVQVQVSHYATISCRRLSRIGASGRRQERKPTLEEIEQARVNEFQIEIGFFFMIYMLFFK